MLKKVFLGILITLIILVGVIVFYFVYLGYQSRTGEPIGLLNGVLAKCPDKPNCVNSEFKEDSAHYIEPLTLPKLLFNDTMVVITSAIESSDGTIVSRQEHYIAATFTSKAFGFVDDLEVRLDKSNGLIHIRSASRVGHSDFGQNRKRVSNIKKRLLPML
ncbi:DUF1499 domain-containing protein [Spartinivicinus ruber]|uniref:DUF1499 domain-containing protein n=1 Tax=Spartinivicinus ruber TaxID=2683272 RepID=UPI0013D85353|nr:DUF1499 domain-containing protein [Spartinivicinus ruber]